MFTEMHLPQEPVVLEVPAVSESSLLQIWRKDLGCAAEAAMENARKECGQDKTTEDYAPCVRSFFAGINYILQGGSPK